MPVRFASFHTASVYALKGVVCAELLHVAPFVRFSRAMIRATGASPLNNSQFFNGHDFGTKQLQGLAPILTNGTCFLSCPLPLWEKGTLAPPGRPLGVLVATNGRPPTGEVLAHGKYFRSWFHDRFQYNADHKFEYSCSFSGSPNVARHYGWWKKHCTTLTTALIMPAVCLLGAPLSPPFLILGDTAEKICYSFFCWVTSSRAILTFCNAILRPGVRGGSAQRMLPTLHGGAMFFPSTVSRRSVFSFFHTINFQRV